MVKSFKSPPLTAGKQRTGTIKHSQATAVAPTGFENRPRFQGPRWQVSCTQVNGASDRTWTEFVSGKEQLESNRCHKGNILPNGTDTEHGTNRDRTSEHQQS